jgi:hypothetical protein
LKLFRFNSDPLPFAQSHLSVSAAEEQCQQEKAESKRKQDEAEAKRKHDEAEAKRKQDEAEAKRKHDEAEDLRRADAIRVAATDAAAHLQRALSASSVALLVAALSAADAAVASHPSLCVTYPHVSALRAEAHTRAAAVAEDGIKEALALAGNSSGNNGVSTGITDASVAALEAAIASAESVPLSDHPQLPFFESLRAALASARRVAAYWSLRLRKADHTQWTCDDVITAFAAVAHIKDLASDSLDAVVSFVSKEKVDGSILSEVESDIVSQVSGQVRRARVSQILKVLCAPCVVANGLGNSAASTVGSSSSTSSASGQASGSGASSSASASSSSSSSCAPPPPPKGVRLLLSDSEFELVTNPITGIVAAPLLSLRDAVRATGIKVPLSCIELASEHHENMEAPCAYGLTPDEIGAVHLYTQECPLYHELNALLRGRDRGKLKTCLSFMRLLVGAMHKLPKHAGRVFRGMTRHLADTVGDDKKGWPLDQAFPIGKKLVWWAASSTSLSIKTLEAFAGKVGRRTVFSIAAKNAVDVMAYSAFGASEKEWVLAPGAKLKVTGVADLGEVAMVELEEMGVPYTLMDFANEQ